MKRCLTFALVICFAAVSLLVLEAGSSANAAQKKKYGVKCEAIIGGQCKKVCSESDKNVKRIEIAEGEQKGIIAETVCTDSGTDNICCVEKDKIKK